MNVRIAVIGAGRMGTLHCRVLSEMPQVQLACVVDTDPQAAEVLAELTDTEVYHLWVTRVTRRYQWARVLFSNAISVPLDSLLFCWLAFGGVLPTDVVWSIFWANMLLKGAVTLLGLPLIYLVKSPEAD